MSKIPTIELADVEEKQEEEKRIPKVAICMPTHDMVPAGFMYDLANMVGFTAASGVADGIFDLAMNMNQGTIVHTSREDLAQQALMTDSDYMLWLDTDHRFPKDSLIRLLNHNKDIVGINYCTRRFPPQYVAFEEIDLPNRLLKKLVTDENSTGLQKAAAIGFGLTLIRSNVFWDMAEDKPWFDFKWIGPGADWVGEDVHFCQKAEKYGYDVWVDADLSKECSHIGQFNYRLDHAAVIADEAAKQKAGESDGEQAEARLIKV